jgi:AcrR family transcriptional regulator
MARWEPDARERFVASALQLFSEQGYDATTVAQIAEGAGLTRSTFFRHFSDKREVLAAGQAILSALFAEGIAEAPEDATPLAAVESGLVKAAGAMTARNRELGPRIEAVIASSAELQERAMLKKVQMASAIADALRARGVDSAVAAVAAELGILAFREAFDTWIADADGGALATLMVASLARLRGAITQL